MVAVKIVVLLIEAFIVAVLFAALFPLTNDAIGNMGLENVSVFGVATDFSWAGYLIILGIILTIAFVGLKYVKNAMGKKGR